MAEIVNYKVKITEPAHKNFREIYEWIRVRSEQGAKNWREKIISAIRSLNQNPERFPLARENASFSETIRHILLGKKTALFRIIFYVYENEVRILAIRRGTQLGIEQKDLDSL